MDNTLRRDIKILEGDINAKIGQNDKNMEIIMGKLSIGKMNENWGRLTQFCETNDRGIGGSVFISQKTSTKQPGSHAPNGRKWIKLITSW